MPAPLHRFWDSEPGRRATAISLALLVQMLVLVLALISYDRSAPEVSETLSTFTVEQPGPPAPEPAKPVQPVEVPPQPPEPILVPVVRSLPSDNPLIAALLEQADATASGGGCDLTAPVEAALQADMKVAETLPSIARDRRSVANALAVWNQLWITADAKFPEPALEAIREAVRLTVIAASDACRAQLQTGPRLIYVAVKDQTTVLALGSGEWTWQQVADSADPQFLLQQAALSPGAPSSRPMRGGKEKTLLERILGQ